MGREQKANGFCAACRPVRRMRRTGPAFPKKARRKPAAGRAGRGNASAAGCMLQAEPKSWKGSTEDMKLTFYGAAKAVTGSCHCLDACGKRILIDCGLQQGQDEVDNAEIGFHPGEVDYVIVTHAHIDHSGRLPLLVKLGYQGSIVTTRLTGELLGIMLRDSAHIQESDAEYQNRKGKRAGAKPVEPLYTLEDAEEALTRLETYDYEQKQTLCEGIEFRFIDAGHLLGSSIVELWVTEDGVTKKLVFSGDLGNTNQPIIRNPQFVKKADYVVMESTYGNRNHEGEGEYTEDLAAIMDETFQKGGNVIIPAFAVGRTQELLYFIREIKERGLVKSLPDFPVYVDSPLARQATTIFSGDLSGYIDEEARVLVRDGVSMLTFDNLILTETVEESKLLNMDNHPKVIISASGMCDAGRIRHHLKHNLWRPECTVVFVGFQAEGSFGRHLLNGAEKVKMFGEEIAVKAKIVNFQGLSSHAGHDALVEWIDAFEPKPAQVFVVHGEAEVTEQFAGELRGMGIPAHSANYHEQYDLLQNCVLEEGTMPPAKKSAEEPLRCSSAYPELLDIGNKVLSAIKANRQGANKNLRAMTEQLKELLKQWEE